MGLVHEKFVFVHVPKTGGTWVRSAIQLAGIPVVESGPFEIEDHYGIREMRAAHPENQTKYISVRPVATLSSRSNRGSSRRMGSVSRTGRIAGAGSTST